MVSVRKLLGNRSEQEKIGFVMNLSWPGLNRYLPRKGVIL